MARTRKGPNVHVVPASGTPGKFVVKAAGHGRAMTTPATQGRSIARAIPVARRNRSEVVIHRADGRIRDSDSYGNDPKRSKDRKH